MSSRRIAIYACVWALCGASGAVAQTPASSPRTDLPTPSGGVGAVAVQGRTMYIAGSFTHLGSPVGSFALLDGATAEPTEPFARVEGEVTALAPDGAGGWYLAGDLVSIAGATVRGIGRLATDGTPSDLDVTVAGGLAKITSMVRMGDRLLVAGVFQRINGIPRPGLAALDAETGELLPWAPALDGDARAVMSHAGSLYILGGFTVVEGEARPSVARFDGPDLTLSEWAPLESGSVSVMAPGGERVYLAGNYALKGGLSARQVAAVDTTTGDPVGWAVTGIDNGVRALLAQEDAVYIGGTFSTIGGHTRLRVAAVDAMTAAVLPMDVSVVHSSRTGAVEGLAMVNGGLVLAGEFDQINLSSRSGVAIVDPVTGDTEPWDAAVAGSVLCLATTDAGEVAVGGAFTVVGGTPRSKVAAIDLDTGDVLPWTVNFRKRSVDPDYAVNSLIATESRVYVGGSFERVDGLVVHGLAAVSPVDGSLDVTFDHGIVSTASPYGLLGLQRSRDVIHPRYYEKFYGLDEATGQQLWGISTGPTARISADPDLPYMYLRLPRYEQIDPPAVRENLAEFDAQSGKLTSWNPGADGQVETVAFQNGRLYVGGSFNQIGGEIRPRFGVFENEDPAARRLGPAPIWEFGFGGSDVIRRLVASDSLLMLGGTFSSVRGESARDFAALTLPELDLLDWTIGENARVALITDREIIITGSFQYLRGVYTPYLAVIPLEGACRVDLDGNGELDFFDFLEFQSLFAAGDPRADFTGDGILDFFDFLAFQDEFAMGCP